MLDDFEGKCVLITGAGSGIGRATAVTFAQAGADVLLADVNQAGNEESAQLVRDAGAQAVTFHCDVSQEDQVAAMVETAVDALGGLDVAVNNAGVEQGVTPLVDQTQDVYDRIMDVNVRGVWLCMKHELKHMLAKGKGAIVNTSAMADGVGSPGLQFYVASKHAVLGLTRSVALETIRQGVRINAVAPGPVETRMLLEHKAQYPEMHAAVQESNPEGRYAQPSEIDDAILYLASEQSSYMVGQSINVDGGATVP